MPTTRPVSRPRKLTRRLASLAALALAGGLLVAPSIATAAVDTPFTFTNPTGSEPWVIQYPATGTVSTTLSGTGPDGAAVRAYSIDSGSLTFDYFCNTTVVAGTWSCNVTFAPLVGSVIAERLGTDGLPVESIDYDLVVVRPPVFAAGSTAVVSNQEFPTISGTVAPLVGATTATVRVKVAGDELCAAAPVSTSGAWSCGLALDSSLDTTLSITAVQTRTAYGVSGDSSTASTTYTLDRVGPTTPATFTTPSGSAFTMTTSTFDLVGTAEPQSKVTVKAGAATLCGPAVTNGSGVWTCTAVAPANGSYSMTIVNTDAAGNAATGGSETVALTVAVTPIVITPPSNYIAPPPIIVPTPNIYVAPPTVPNETFYFDAILVEQNGPLTGTEPLENMQSIVVQGLQDVVNLTGGSTSSFSVTLDLNLANLYPSIFGTVQTTAPSTPIPDWQRLPQDYQAFMLLDAQFTASGTGDSGFAAGSGTSALASMSRTAVELPADTIVLDQQRITGDGKVTLEGTVPEGLEGGTYDLTIRIAADDDSIEPLDVSVPVTIESTVAAPAAEGVAWWVWALVALLVLAVIATIILVARRQTRRA